MIEDTIADMYRIVYVGYGPLISSRIVLDRLLMSGSWSETIIAAVSKEIEKPATISEVFFLYKDSIRQSIVWGKRKISSIKNSSKGEFTPEHLRDYLNGYARDDGEIKSYPLVLTYAADVEFVCEEIKKLNWKPVVFWG